MSDLSKLFDLNGRAALITGGAGVIGTRVSHGLAAHGAKVAIADINLDAAQTVAAEITEAYGTQTLAIKCDVADPAAVQAMVAETVESLGSLDILHNNAAAKAKDLKAFFAPTEEYSLDVWREIMSVNVDGLFLVAQAAGKQMIAQGNGGSIIQTASIYGMVGPDPRIYAGSKYLGVEINTPPVYAASKGAVIALSKYLATHWAEHNIRVNTLIPGGVESGQNDTFKTNYAHRVPLGRMAESDEMVGLVIYLGSDASTYVTGQSIAVDGGWTAW